MSYRLVIAEKPSVAMSIVRVLKVTQRESGYLSGGGWLVSINATRLFSVLYGRTLNIGRVMSPILALIVQREAEIAAFEPVPFYTVELNCGNVAFDGEWISGKEDAATIAAACEGSAVTIRAVERREKSESAPALYDLTTLQRDANRILGYTAQQTLDYLQALYEKKLCTYPRTDSRYLTGDMENTVPALVSSAGTIYGVTGPEVVLAAQVCNSKKVTDHHAVVPTKSAADANIAALPLGEREILRLISLGLLRAVCPPHRYTETVVSADCGGYSFTAKGKTVSPGTGAVQRGLGALPSTSKMNVPPGGGAFIFGMMGPSCPACRFLQPPFSASAPLVYLLFQSVKFWGGEEFSQGNVQTVTDLFNR